MFSSPPARRRGSHHMRYYRTLLVALAIGLFLFLVRITTLPSVVTKFSIGRHENLIVVVGFHKDDPEMLDLWFTYYCGLFGPQNVVLIDNNSDDPAVFPILDKWEKRGAKVERGQGPFQAKGTLWLRMAHKYYPDAKLFFPSDIDEFLLPFNPVTSNPVLSKSLLLERLRTLTFRPNNVSGWKVLVWNSLNCNPTETLLDIQWFYPYVQLDKNIWRMSQVISIDQGNHVGSSHYGSTEPTPVALGMLNYHAVGLEKTALRALEVIKSQGYIPRNTTLANVTVFLPMFRDLSGKNVPSLNKIRWMVRYLDHETRDPQCASAIQLPWQIKELIHTMIN